MDKIKELELQIKIMANTIDTQEKIIKELKLRQPDIIKSVCDHDAPVQISNDRLYWICGKCGTRIN